MLTCKYSLAPIGRARNALPLGNGGGSRNPGKRDKMPSVAFYPASFLAKTCQSFLLTNDAPSLALLILQDKMTRSLADTEWRTQYREGICSKKFRKKTFSSHKT